MTMHNVMARLDKISLTKTEVKTTASGSKKDNYRCIKTKIGAFKITDKNKRFIYIYIVYSCSSLLGNGCRQQ
jgi:hypothetical protein